MTSHGQEVLGWNEGPRGKTALGLEDGALGFLAVVLSNDENKLQSS